MVRAAALLALWPGGAEACRLALILAMDVSSSVNAKEDALQRGGLAAALVAPDVQAAFFASADPVALAVFEWSGRYNQEDLLGWTLIETPEDLAAAAARIAGSSRSHNDFPTAMGHALGHAAVRLDAAPDGCQSRTVDLAGDGENNDGFGPAEAYAAFDFDGVTVNGLVVNAGEYEAEVNLIAYYRAQVLRGPGAFLEIANGFENYASAMERKLIRELSAMVLGGAPRVGSGG
ncbi:DUF1194 domain-containing protein [Yoonia sp. R2331]|uniref:DUF1194 domain-containing protein n=1 Tax=Yoonia sp. R2331 TaxID=3237238 RepID=UPI0034E3FEF7